jgi:two-component system chemotaxis response regulator CheB
MPSDESPVSTPPGPPIVALVASAGGLEAVMLVLGGLPAGFPGAVVVLIHQSPDNVASQLAEILGRRGPLPVARPHDGDPILPGQVLVVPPGRHMLIGADMRVKLITSGSAPPSRPSADLLLATLAVSARERAIAVVLSGGGHDGATGATAVHACGGTVIASDRASSRYFGMPGSTIDRDDAIDHVVPLDEIGDKLVELVARQPARA